MKVVIIGGVAGGATAAARLRRLNEQAEIVVLERSGYVSYANCGLPYYVGGVIQKKSALTLQTPQSFRARFRIDVRVHSEAVAIDREKKQVLVRETQTGREYTERYDKLILSPGAKALVRVDVLPYQRAAGAKYDMVGRAYAPDFDENRAPRMYIDRLKRAGIAVQVFR